MLEILASASDNKNKWISSQISKKGVKLTLCIWHGTLGRNSERLHQKNIEPIHELSTITGYKINVQKSVAFLYTNNEATEKEIKKTIPFIIIPKIIKR